MTDESGARTATDASPEVLHVLGCARPGDPVAAAARGLCAVLGRAGRPGRLVEAADLLDGEPGDLDRIERHGAALVVHSSDGGEALVEALPALIGRPLTLVHHGSIVGSDRRALRALRGPGTHAVAADPAAREELRGLGFGTVAALDPRAVDGALDGVAPDPEAVARLAAHPGPMILHAGPLGPNRGLEALLGAFAELVTGGRPSATLSLCGPAERWYLATLDRRIRASGLVACELVQPESEGQVVARLGRADAVVSVRPRALDPYLRHAARAGTPIVAPPVGATALLGGGSTVVPVGPSTGTDELTEALRAATEPGARRESGEPPAPPAAVLDEAALVRALGLR